MAVRLSQGSISAIMEGETVVKPVLQLINIRPISTGNGPPRYRLLMSDGANTLSSFMLATQLNSMVDEQKLVANTVCQVNRFIVNTMKDGRRVVILMDVDVIRRGAATTATIGNPVQYSESSRPGGNPPQAAGPTANQAPSSSTPLQQNESSAGSSAGNMAKHNSAASAAAARPFGKPCRPGTPGSILPKVVPIASLNPYQSKWTICVRVTQKGQIRTWSNSRGEGRLFSIELVDESGEIRATAFNDQADKFFPLIEMNKVYYFSKGTLKTANKQYTAVKNEYEIAFTNDTVVVPCEEDLNLPSIKFDFVSIGDLEKVDKEAIVDIIGVCQSYADVTKVIVKSTNREVSKRDVHLMDMSGKMVTVALWGPEAEKFDGSRHPVVAIKGSRVSDFGGRSLSVLASSTVIVNPDRPEAFKLRGWFDSEGQRLEPVSISNTRAAFTASGNTFWKTLHEAKTENLGQRPQADYFSCVGTVVHMRKDNCLYQACPTVVCHKKVIDEHNGLYRCEKCDQDFPSFKYRMILGVNIADFQTNQWITCFQEAAEIIVGQSTTYLGELKEKDERAFEEVFQKANFSTYEFRIRVKHDNYNDEFRLKMSAVEVKPVSYKEYGRHLIVNIRKHAAALRS